MVSRLTLSWHELTNHISEGCWAGQWGPMMIDAFPFDDVRLCETMVSRSDNIWLLWALVKPPTSTWCVREYFLVAKLVPVLLRPDKTNYSTHSISIRAVRVQHKHWPQQNIYNHRQKRFVIRPLSSAASLAWLSICFLINTLSSSVGQSRIFIRYP